jgi:hypothetical protein
VNFATRVRLSVYSKRLRVRLDRAKAYLPHFWLFTISCGTVIYLALLNIYMSPYASATDASGYMNFAKQLAQGEIFLPVRSLPAHAIMEFGTEAFQPMGWLVRDNSGLMSPYYPPGAPFHFALASWLVGEPAAVNLANTLLTIAAGILLYLSCRHLKMAKIWALGAVGALYLCPLFIFGALQPYSELPALTWSLATLYAAMRSSDRPLWPICCGAAFSVAVLVRPTNILLALPILLASELRLRRMIWLGLGSLPGGLLLLYLNWRLYSSPFTTGQASLLQQMSIGYLPHNLFHFGRWTFVLLGPMTLCSLAFLFFRQLGSRDYLIQASWLMGLVGFYAFYSDAGLDAWWWLRYLLPAYPSLIILATAGLRKIWIRVFQSYQTVARWGIAAAIIILSFGWEVIFVPRVGGGELLTMAQSWKLYRDGPRWTQQNIHPDAIIVCSDFSGAFYYYTNFTVLNYGNMDTNKVREFLLAAGMQGRPMYAVLSDFEINGEDVGRTKAWRILIDAWSRMGGHTKVFKQFDERHFIIEFVPAG